VSAAFTVGAKGTVGQLYDVVETWSGKAKDIRGEALPCGHSPHEEIPEIFFTVFSLFSEQCYNAPVLLNFLTDYEKILLVNITASLMKAGLLLKIYKCLSPLPETVVSPGQRLSLGNRPISVNGSHCLKKT
jgi:hypothetical protein